MNTTPSANRAPFHLGEVAEITGGRIRQGAAGDLAQGVGTDTRALRAGNLFVALRGESFDGHRFVAQAASLQAQGAVVQRGFEAPADLPAGFGLVEVDDTLAALGALARAHRRRFPALRVGAVTGSNGKTTTKELAATVLEAAFGKTLKTEGNLNNEIGLPLTLLRLEESHVAACVELGMNHLGEIARLTAIAEPAAGVVTCVQPVHLEGLGSLEAVARAKGELYFGLGPDAVAVANHDDPLALAEARASGRELLTFGGADADVRLERILSHDRRGLAFEVRIRGGEPRRIELPLVGLHNVGNACGALALGLALGADPDAAIAGLQRAKGFARRLELKEAPGGFTVLDDCYNGNPASAVAALRTARALAGDGRVVAVLGDLRELGAEERAGHEEVGRAAAAAGVEALVAFGGCADWIAGAARGGGVAEEAICATDDPALALSWLRPRLRAGDLVVVKASRGTRLERIADPLVEAN